MQRPPHHLHRVALRRPRGQGIQTDATPGVLHVFPHPLACVAAVVVCCEVQLFVAAVSPAQMVEQLDEKLSVLAPRGHPMEAPRLEVERPANPCLAVGPRSAQGPLPPPVHPAEAHLGVGLQLGLVLEERPRFLGHLQDILKPRVLLYDLFLRAFLGRDGARPPPAEAQAVQRAAECLPAHKRGGPLPEKLEGKELAAPARAQPAMLGGRILLQQLLDTLTRLLPEQRSRTAPSVVVEGGAVLPEEAGDNGVDGGARAEEDASDLGGREPVEGEQRDVHPEPSTGLRFALHLDDKALAFLGGDGDILHVRSSLWWLDGCGVFTMPQRTAACSIILCIYLARPCASGFQLDYAGFRHFWRKS